MNDFVIGICSKWPLNASYPIHLGAMLTMHGEDESKSTLYSFILDDPHYDELSSALKQYSGSDIQAHIKQMANLCNTVGATKFASLSPNILKSFKSALDGNAFELDFSPLLQHQAESQNNEKTKSEEQPVKKPKPKKKKKKKQKSSVSATASNKKAKQKQKLKT